MRSAAGNGAGGTRQRIESFLDAWMVDHDVPGLSVACFDPDGLRYANGLGARNIEDREPATPETCYSVASVTKTVTALATLRLVDRGRLDLADEIREYVSVWDDVPGDPITVGDLLSHSAGMPLDYGGQREPLFSETAPTSPLVTREDRIRHANGATDRRIEEPAGYLYSNRGYQILGEIVEVVADRTHADFVERELFDPLGMDRSQVGHGEVSNAADDAMTGYRIDDGVPVETPFDLEAGMDPPYAAGGMLSSVTDLSRLGRCLLDGGDLDGTHILSEELVDAMCDHQAPPWTTIDGHDRGYGYGTKIVELADATLVGHTGTSPVSRAYVGMDRERGLGVAMAANTASVPIEALAFGVLAIARGRSPTASVPRIALQEKIAAVTGTYVGYRGGVTVAVDAADDGGYLEVDYRDGPGWTFPAFPESTGHDDYRFYRVRRDGLREPVTFHETADGMEMRCNIDCLVRRTADGPSG